MTKPPLSSKPVSPLRGYIEGYYGQLLDWPQRHAMLDVLSDCGMNAYLYAPKEDPSHRLRWRDDWSADWWAGFRTFTKAATAKEIDVIAGVAPGLDFDFGSLNRGHGDTALLIRKAEKLVEAGAASINLLMDDIDPGFNGHAGGYASEGLAHADLANHLADCISVPVSMTPRVYADEIAMDDETYLEDFTSRIQNTLMIWTCGSHIVAPQIDLEETKLAHLGLSPDRMIVWDNLYANDYCPRRLFLGLWQGRDKASHILLNPTGFPYTDGLLLHLMVAGEDREKWKTVFENHGVPSDFFSLASFLDLPPDPTSSETVDLFDRDQADTWLAALDTLLWRWKSPLQREWYPYLMGLRGDILYRQGDMASLRIEKIFPPLIMPKD